MNMKRALALIAKNFNDQDGWLSPREVGYKPTALEWEAVDYLIDEWDYAFIPTPISEEELNGRYSTDE